MSKRATLFFNFSMGLYVTVSVEDDATQEEIEEALWTQALKDVESNVFDMNEEELGACLEPTGKLEVTDE